MKKGETVSPSWCLPVELPKKFPASLDTWMLLVIGRRAPDRARLFRCYLRDGIRLDRAVLQQPQQQIEKVPVPSDDDVAAAFAKYKNEGFQTEQDWKVSARDFQLWELGLLSRRGKQAAAVRWSKSLDTASEHPKEQRASDEPATSICKTASSIPKAGKKHLKRRK